MRLLILFLASLLAAGAAHARIRVGSKAFTEGYLLGELAAQKIEMDAGRPVERRFGLGNTGVVFEALKKGEIDVYPEYTGTISEAILFDPNLRDPDELRARLAEIDLVMSESLGFSNTYALAVRRAFAEKHGLRKISDLRRLRVDLRTAFSHEFVSRADGLAGLQKFYGIDLSAARQSLEHSLAFEAIGAGKVDLIEVYSTDAKIRRLDLRVLEDDRGYFPAYQAVYLARRDFAEREPEAWALLRELAGSLDAEGMRELNAGVEIDKRGFARVIALHLNRDDADQAYEGPSVAARIWQRTREHALLVGITVFLSVVTGVPLGILAARRARWGQALLLLASVVQTVPSLALLCLLIPLFGIGLVPALVALYLYSLLPILLNTHIGLRSIDPRLIETAHALGLSRARTLWHVELPLASRSILGGVKTSTVIGIGTATLAALIGAGGYGAPIVSGLAINDTRTILLGAIPAALMALAAHFGFELLGRWLVPRGLRRS